MAQTHVSYSFSSGQPAVANEVNQNFQDLVDAINTLQATVAMQQSTIQTLQNQLTTVQANSVLALDGYLQLTSMADPITGSTYDVARFTGVNVQIVNGVGMTGSRNGLGNLIVGYNEVDADAPMFCSREGYATQADCESNLGVWQNNQRTGSHNLILGYSQAYSQYGGLVAGFLNAIGSRYSSVSGGQRNVSVGFSSAITGGSSNRSQGIRSVVVGGSSNTASGGNATVSGGQSRSATGTFDWTAGSLYEDF